MSVTAMTFRQWLLSQADRPDSTGDLAREGFCLCWRGTGPAAWAEHLIHKHHVSRSSLTVHDVLAAGMEWKEKHPR